MTLDEAIIHAEKAAERNEEYAKIHAHGDEFEQEDAFKCEECAKEHRQLAEWLKDYKRLIEQNPCEDCISRSEAIKLFTYNYKGERIPDYDCDNFPVQIAMKTVKEMLKELPPVKSQPKMGRWIVNEWGNISCSECGCTALYDKVYPGESVFGKVIRVKSTFCPTCGVKMQEVKQ